MNDLETMEWRDTEGYETLELYRTILYTNRN